MELRQVRRPADPVPSGQRHPAAGRGEGDHRDEERLRHPAAQRAPIPTPTVYKDRLYVSGGFHSREYYCFDAESGKPVWGVNLDDDGPTSAACQDGVILFNTESCTIFALDAETGKQLWSLFLGDPLTNTPTIANGKVFTAYPCAAAGTGGKAPPPCSHVLAAFDLKTGKILWQRWIDSDVMLAPVAVDKELYVTSFAGTVYKLNQDDGTLLSAMRSRATSAPIVVADHIFLTRRADDGKGAVSETVASDGATRSGKWPPARRRRRRTWTRRCRTGRRSRTRR